MRRAAFLLVLVACGGKGRKTLPPPDASGGVGVARPSADAGAGAAGPAGYRVIEIAQPATLTLAIPPVPGPAAPPAVVQQSPHEPDPCTLTPDATFAYLEVSEGAAATAPDSPSLLAVRCGHLVPHALVLAPASAPLILTSRDDARHVLDLEPPSGPTRRIPLPLRGSRVTVTLPVGFTRIACELHPDEVAHVLVSDHPYASVVSGDSVRWDNLPPPARSYDVVIAHVGAQGAPSLLRRSARSVVGDAPEPAAGTPADEPPQAPVIALDPALDDALVRAAAPHLPPHLRSGKPLAEAILAVSDRYTTERAGLATAGHDPPAELAARTLFFLGADLCKIHVPLAELDDAGLLGAPARVLDLGAGVGTQTIGLIAWLGARARFAVELWDRDPGALALAKPLCEAAAAQVGAQVAVTTRTGDLAAPAGGNYDLILMGTTLNELFLGAPDPVAARATLLGGLVAALAETGSLIVIEPALRETSRALEQVRDRLLAAGQGHVFAPCTRGAPCPALAEERDFCHEDRTFQPSPRLARLISAVGLREHGLKFAYLTLRRAAACHAPGPDWSRVVSAPLGSKGKTEWFVCGEAGRTRLRVLGRERGAVREIARDLDRGDAVRAPAGVPSERRARRP